MLDVRLFGKLEIRCDGQIPAGINARKVQELFCYLLLYRDRPHPRETLAGLLWGDTPTPQSKKYLRNALWQLQAAMETQAEPTGSRVLLLEPDWIQLNPDADLWLDVAVFEQTFGLVRGVPGQELDARRTQALQSAVQLYQGGLLEGWYQDWCLYERERLQNNYLAMLDKLVGYCEAHHNYEAGLVWGSRILRCDRARERTHRRLMRLYYLAGNRTAALRQYECCVAALDEELGVKAAKRTVALYDQIRADQLDGIGPAPVEGTVGVEATTGTILGVLGRLKHLQAVLAEARRQVQQDVEALEVALNGQH